MVEVMVPGGPVTDEEVWVWACRMVQSDFWLVLAPAVVLDRDL